MRALAFAALVALAGAAGASPLDEQPVGARAIGRAGAVVASVSGAAALAVNPAGLTRGDDVNLELGLSLSGLHVGFQRHATDALVYPHAESHAPAQSAPFAGVTAVLAGGRLAFAAAYYPASAYAVAYPGSTATSRAPIVDPQRYMVTSFGASRRALAAGVAVRPLPWLSLGASFLACDVAVSLTRTAWVGFDVDRPQSEDPRLDMPFAAQLASHFVPALGLGFTVAPARSPLELGASVELSADASLHGTLSPTLPVMLPSGFATITLAGRDTLSATLPMPVVWRGGARLRGRRADIETTAEVSLLPGSAAWTAHSGLSAVLGRVSNDPAPYQPALDPVPLGVVARTRFALRVGGDLVLVPGLLTARAGYAYLSAASDSPLASALEPGNAEHILAAGLAASHAGLTLEAGYSHGFQLARSVPDSAWQHWNPIGGASAEIGAGRYTAASDRIMISLAIALGEARRAFAPPPAPPAAASADDDAAE